MKLKHGIKVCLVALAFMAPGLGMPAYAAAGKVTEVVGDVKVGQRAAVVGQGFESGVTVTTGPDAHAILDFADGQRIAVGENSAFKIDEYDYQPQAPTKSRSFTSLLRGAFRAITGLIADKNRDGVRYTAATATMGIRGTVFAVSIVEGTTFVQATSGTIVVTTTSGAVVTVAAGQTVAISAVTGAITATGAAAANAATAAGAFTQVNTIGLTAATAGAAGTGATAAAAGGLSAGAIAGISAVVGAVAAVAAQDETDDDGATSTSTATSTAP